MDVVVRGVPVGGCGAEVDHDAGRGVPQPAPQPCAGQQVVGGGEVGVEHHHVGGYPFAGGGDRRDGSPGAHLDPLDRGVVAQLDAVPFGGRGQSRGYGVDARRLDAAIVRVLADPPHGTIAAAVAGLPDVVEEIRVALAAGYDTTAHTLSWALWHLAGAPQWRDPGHLDAVLDEILRLYPAGWLGSRVASRDTQADGVDIPAGTMVFYSPYLTHRDPQLWDDPDTFRPDRFSDGRPAWGYIPFAAGRTCLGNHLARLMLRTAVGCFRTASLTQLVGDPSIRSSITLRPAGPLWIDRR